MPAGATCSWRITHESVRGAAHVRAGLENQDAVDARSAPGDRPPVVLAVADGHGSPRSFRSKQGANLAVQLAVAAATRLLEDHRDIGPSRIEREARDLLPAEIVTRWHQAVQRHWEEHPCTPAELAKLGHEAAEAAASITGEAGALARAYGSTLLLAGVGEGFAFYLQLGDGDILVASAGAPQEPVEVHHPLPPDGTLIANETTSLCMAGAQGMFRFHFHHYQERPPALVLLATDGYFNSFRTPADFEQVASDLVRLIAREGWEYVSHHLHSWLDEASRSGSGDDASLGILYREGAVDASRPAPAGEEAATALAARAAAAPAAGDR